MPFDDNFRDESDDNFNDEGSSDSSSDSSSDDDFTENDEIEYLSKPPSHIDFIEEQWESDLIINIEDDDGSDLEDL
jgi:hypothetical protein